jgi:hypothetical protein
MAATFEKKMDEKKWGALVSQEVDPLFPQNISASDKQIHRKLRLKVKDNRESGLRGSDALQQQ